MPGREPRSTIGIRASTKAKLNQNRAPGQCYDGFICQLIEVWKETHREGVFTRNRAESSRISQLKQ